MPDRTTARRALVGKTKLAKDDRLAHHVVSELHAIVDEGAQIAQPSTQGVLLRIDVLVAVGHLLQAAHAKPILPLTLQEIAQVAGHDQVILVQATDLASHLHDPGAARPGRFRCAGQLVLQLPGEDRRIVAVRLAGQAVDTTHHAPQVGDEERADTWVRKEPILVAIGLTLAIADPAQIHGDATVVFPVVR